MNINKILKSKLSEYLKLKYDIDFIDFEIQLTRKDFEGDLTIVVFPLVKILKQNHITPSSTVFSLKHDNVVTMVYQKQVDAGATFYSPPSKEGLIRDARILVKSQYPDVEEKIKILTSELRTLESI